MQLKLFTQNNTAPKNVKVIGDVDILEGENLNITCSYERAVPEITSVKFCLDETCVTQPIVSFSFVNNSNKQRKNRLLKISFCFMNHNLKYMLEINIFTNYNPCSTISFSRKHKQKLFLVIFCCVLFKKNK